MKLKNNRGFSLVELMVSASILLIIICAFIASLTQNLQFVNRLEGKKEHSQLVVTIMETIRGSFMRQQIEFDASEERLNELLLDESLPLAWSKDGIFNLIDCPGCKGRAGYVIQPLEGFRGLYLLTVKVKDSVDDPTGASSIYQTILGAK